MGPPPSAAVQPVDPSVDYFLILGLERKFEVEEGANLDGKYKDWQKKLHPDLVHSKSQKELEFAVEQSALVTESYRTLTNPLLRAFYILRLEGVNVNEEETVSEPEMLLRCNKDCNSGLALSQVHFVPETLEKLWLVFGE